MGHTLLLFAGLKSYAAAHFSAPRPQEPTLKIRLLHFSVRRATRYCARVCAFTGGEGLAIAELLMLKILPPSCGIVSLIAFYFLSDLPAFQTLPDWSNRLASLALLVLGLAPSFLAVAQFRRAGTQVRPDSETNN